MSARAALANGLARRLGLPPPLADWGTGGPRRPDWLGILTKLCGFSDALPHTGPRPPGWLGILTLSLLLGCAGWRGAAETASSASSTLRQRQAALLQDFEQRRDAAQLAAALDRWQEDPAAARQLLSRLVERRPEHFEARLRLGELLWAEGDGPAAEAQLRQALLLRPDAAEAHHALGLVLCGTGRQFEGQQHLRRAAELAPDNEAYRLACQF